MVRALFFSFFLVCTFAGCATHEAKPVDLYERYVALAELVASSKIRHQREHYFGPDYLKEVSDKDEKSLALLMLPGYLEQVVSHHQKINRDSGCLTVNGFDQGGEPMVLHFEYRNINSRWLVHYIYLDFLDSSNKFMDKAVCPNEAMNLEG